MALQLLERTAGRRRRRCGNVIPQNAGKAGAAWSICSVCVPAIAAEAWQLEIEPPLIRRCLVCRTLLGDRRRGARTCGPGCRTLLSRILRVSNASSIGYALSDHTINPLCGCGTRPMEKLP